MRTANFYSNIFRKYINDSNVKIYSSTISNLKKIDEYLDKHDNIIILYVGHGMNSGNDWSAISTKENKLIDIYDALKTTYFGKDKNITVILDCCNVLPANELRYQQNNYSAIKFIFNLVGCNVVCSSSKAECSWFFDGNTTLFYTAFDNCLNSKYNDIFELLIGLNNYLKQLYKKYNIQIPINENIIYYDLDSKNITIKIDDKISTQGIGNMKSTLSKRKRQELRGDIVSEND